MENVDRVTKACVVLHNFLMVEESKEGRARFYCPQGYADYVDADGNIRAGELHTEAAHDPTTGLAALKPTHSRNFVQAARNVRNIFTKYFSSPAGEVSWQWKLPGVLVTNDS